MVIVTAHQVDRLYRALPTMLDDAMLARPTYDDAPRTRRPPDELPPNMTEALNLWVALDCLTLSQRIVYKAVVMGIMRQEVRPNVWRDVPREPMTYRQAGEALDLDEGAIGQHLRRARIKLAAAISDEEEVA